MVRILKKTFACLLIIILILGVDMSVEGTPSIFKGRTSDSSSTIESENGIQSDASLDGPIEPTDNGEDASNQTGTDIDNSDDSEDKQPENTEGNTGDEELDDVLDTPGEIIKPSEEAGESSGEGSKPSGGKDESQGTITETPSEILPETPQQAETVIPDEEETSSNEIEFLNETYGPISLERAEGIAQIQTLIPDVYFAEAVYDSMKAEGYLDSDKNVVTSSVRTILGEFTGSINGSGRVDRATKYKLTYFNKSTLLLETKEFDIINLDYTTEKEVEAEAQANVPKECIFVSIELIDFVKSDKPDEQKIASIEGIQWLRKSSTIDLSYNLISDLTPLDIKKLALLQTDVAAEIRGQTWFGERGKNTKLMTGGNQILRFPESVGGRLNWALASESFEIKQDPYIIIKPTDEQKDWSASINVNIPEIRRDNDIVDISKESTKISEDTTGGATLDSTNMTNRLLPVSGIKQSGTFLVSVSISDASKIGRYVSAPTGSNSEDISQETERIKYNFTKQVRVLHMIQLESQLKFQNQITLTNLIDESTNSANGTSHPAQNAQYKLYKVTKQEGTNQEELTEVSNKLYTTDEQGQFQITEVLEPGDYRLKEEVKPSNLVLNTDPINFSIADADVRVDGGTKKITPTGEPEITAGENATYIDRYSDPIVIEAIIPDNSLSDGNTGKTVLDKIILHIDGIGDQEFKTAADAEKWVNENKGTEKTEGIIQGNVVVEAIFGTVMSLNTTSKMETEPFMIEKIDGQTNEALDGVQFKLECIHTHDTICGGVDDPTKCQHLHFDHVVKENVEDACAFESVIESATIDGKVGVVNFGNLISGTYKLSEVSTVDGYSLPTGYWMVTIDATDNAVNPITIEEFGNAQQSVKEEVNGTITFKLKNSKKLPFAIIKLDADDKTTILPGAKFALYKAKHEHDKSCGGLVDEGNCNLIPDLVSQQNEDQWTLVSEAETNEQGKLDFGLLEDGTYQLVESEAPSGYRKPTGQWRLSVKVADQTLKISAKGDSKPPAIEETDQSGIYKLYNYKTYVLPAMGGMGTTLFIYLGIFLIGGATILNVLRNKKKIISLLKGEK